MDIVIASLLEGARHATGAVAVIDVFRAFTTAAVALANGASRIVMVGSVEQAFALRAAGVGQVCMGEVGGRPPLGFDFGNSPFELSTASFHGETIIQRTSAGTQGIVAASGAERLAASGAERLAASGAERLAASGAERLAASGAERLAASGAERLYASGAEHLYAASLVTARATARALEAANTGRITLVAMGDRGTERTDEDELCALHLRNLLQGRPGHPDAIRNLIRAGGEIARFEDPARPHLHRQDADIALDIDRYDFAIRVTIEHGLPVARIDLRNNS